MHFSFGMIDTQHHFGNVVLQVLTVTKQLGNIDVKQDFPKQMDIPHFQLDGSAEGPVTLRNPKCKCRRMLTLPKLCFYYILLSFIIVYHRSFSLILYSHLLSVVSFIITYYDLFICQMCSL